jgi:hypothetical protein
MLEEMLAGRANINYTYTKTPGQMPTDKIFPDYFLLESRAGYCTYYATAFVLLVRELGLPARYVQGYLVADERLGKDVVNVSDSMAHAWPEVYFQGIGWIPFEPTPGFGGARYRFWEPSGPARGAEGGNPYQWEETGANDANESEVTDPVSAVSPPGYRLFEVVLVIIMAIIISGAALILADKLIKRRQYRLFSIPERFIGQIHMNLQILNMIGYRLMPGETIAEFAKRVRQTETELSLDFIAPLERMIYRGDIVTEKEISIVVADRDQLFRMIYRTDKRRYYLIRVRIFLSPGST